jgi:hypothetical protein
MAAIPKVVITNELVQEWTDLAIEQLQSGWSYAAIRRQLTKSGCTPKVQDIVIANAKKKVRGEERRGGVAALGIGAGLMALAVVIVLLQGEAATVMVPSGLFLVGLVSFARGAFKFVFG